MMRRFTIRDYEIEIDDICEYYNEILIAFKHIAEKSKENFLDNCRQCKDLDELVENAYIYGWKEIDSCLDSLMTVLVKFKIYNYSKEDIYKIYVDNYFNYEKMYIECCWPYFEIVMTEQQLEELRTQQKIGSSRWEGGGFGIKGAVKGAVTAWGMNQVSKGIRTFFASIGTRMDNAKIKKLKNKVFEDKAFLEKLAVRVKKCCNNISIVLIEILRLTGRIDDITGWDFEQSTTIYKNSFYADTQKLEMLVEALKLYPYNWDIYLELFQSTSRFDHQVASVAAYFGFEMELQNYFIEQVPVDEIFFSDAVLDDAVSIQSVWENYENLSKKLQQMGLVDSAGILRKSLLEDFQFFDETEMLESALAEMRRRLRKVERVSCHSMNDVRNVFRTYEKSYKSSAEKAMYELALHNRENNPAGDYVVIAEEPFSDKCATMIRMDGENLIQNTLLYYEEITDESENQVAFIFTDRCLYVSSSQYKNYRTTFNNVRKVEIKKDQDIYYLIINIDGEQDNLKLALPEYKESYKLDEFINQLIQCGERYKANREAESIIIHRWNRIDKNKLNDFDTVLNLLNGANKVSGFEGNIKAEMKEYLTKIKLIELRKQIASLLDAGEVKSNVLEDIKKEVKECNFLSDEARKETLNEIENTRYILQQQSLDKFISSKGGFDCQLKTRSNYQFAQEIMSKTDEKSKKRNDIVAISNFIKKCDEAISHAKYYEQERMDVFSDNIIYMVILYVAYHIVQKGINFLCNTFWSDVGDVAPIRLTLWLIVLFVTRKNIKSVFQKIGKGIQILSEYRKQLKEIDAFKDLFQKDVKFLNQTILGISTLALCVVTIGVCANCFQDLKTTVNAVVAEPYNISNEVEKIEDENYVFTDSDSTYVTEAEMTDLSMEEKQEDSVKDDSRADASPWSIDYLKYTLESNDFELCEFSQEEERLLEKLEEDNLEKVYLRLTPNLYENEVFVQSFEESEWVYKGELKKEKPDGYGSIFRAINIGDDVRPCYVYQVVYEGQFSKGKFSGYGKKYYYFHDDGDMSNYSIGIRQSDDPQQYITDYFNELEYIGNFEDSVYSGKGNLFSYPSKYFFLSDTHRGDALSDTSDPAYRWLSITTGEFKKGEANGKIKDYFGNYLYYDGEMKNDLKNGKGTLYYELSNQVKYEGEFLADEIRGEGTLYSFEGEEICTGEWRSNMCGIINADDYISPNIGIQEEEELFNDDEMSGYVQEDNEIMTDSFLYHEDMPQSAYESDADLYYSEDPDPVLENYGFYSEEGDAGYGYVLEDSARRYLTADELSYMSKSELRLARNEIYARHGRMFDSADLQNYFNSMDWYYGTIPAAEFDESVLNEYEKANLILIREIENSK